MQRHGLTHREWARLEPLLPPRPHTGRLPKDHRPILDALLWLARTGAPWRDLPERFGPWRTVATRFYRWSRSGLWDRILLELQRMADAAGGIDWEVHNGRRHERAGAPLRRRRKRGRLRQALGRSRGGFGSKLHLRSDRRGRPMAFVLTPGERNEKAALPELMSRGAVKRRGPGRPKLRPRVVVGDRGYSGKPTRDHLRRRGISPVIPQLTTEKTPLLMDRGYTGSATWSSGWSGS